VAPAGLEASTFSVGDDEYVVFSFPLQPFSIPPGLTPAEIAVVEAVLEGRSNAEIARARGTSTNTVANQLRSIYAKLGVDGRLSLVKRCLGDG
jgi:DNA-binding CsgD family transcriptional regulator